ncbi:MAG TPA: acyl-CoA synthetase FdrA, partial [Chloroflexota bacterium]
MSSPLARGLIHRHTYRDSVEMMRLASQVETLPGVARAAALMATPANLVLLAEAGLAFDGLAGAAPDDLVVALVAADASSAEAALARATALLAEQSSQGDGLVAAPAPPSLELALREAPEASLVLVSTPGPYAGAEALKALKRGCHVFLFSDNVPLAEEVALKRLARERGRLVMGPDCGTAIVDGVPLGFANVVRPGRIGLVAASGTGLQQVTTLIDRLGAGVSQAIGVGGRDLSEAVGGAMMLGALEMLAAEPGTDLIVLISKPPAPTVGERVLAAARGCGKPVVACFIGGREARQGSGLPGALAPGTVTTVRTLADGAAQAVALTGGARLDEVAAALAVPPAVLAEAGRAAGALAPSQVAVRGLFAGGTFCYEAQLLLEERLGSVAHVEEGRPDDLSGHAVVDLGGDAFTLGRPHPMIDPRLRNEWLIATAADPSAAVLLVDVVLGHGAHPDPGGALAAAIGEARRRAAAAGRALAVVASVCGTASDPQPLAGQEQALRAAGALLAPSNAAAAGLAASIVIGRAR